MKPSPLAEKSLMFATKTVALCSENEKILKNFKKYKKFYNLLFHFCFMCGTIIIRLILPAVLQRVKTKIRGGSFSLKKEV